MEILRDVGAIYDWVQHAKALGTRVALIPTMGALHSGHLSLIALAKQRAEKVVVSIFVNPTQFGPSEDFDRYPRSEEEDRAKLKECGVDAVYLPTVDIMYPQGFTTTVKVSKITEGLCGKSRPGHFDGVATVVSKLLLQSSADVAVFGEKDYQQLLVIKRVVDDLNIPVEIVPAPIEREESGLAMSSRNRYLNDHERIVAAKLFAGLRTASILIQQKPQSVNDILLETGEHWLGSGFDAIDYLELRDAETLDHVHILERPARLLAAVQLGKTRLIDNIAVEPKV